MFFDIYKNNHDEVLNDIFNHRLFDGDKTVVLIAEKAAENAGVTCMREIHNYNMEKVE